MKRFPSHKIPNKIIIICPLEALNIKNLTIKSATLEENKMVSTTNGDMNNLDLSIQVF